MAGHLGSLLTLDPLEAALRGQTDTGVAPIDASLIRRPGLALRLAVTPLKAGGTHYITESGAVVGPDAITPIPGAGPGTVDAVDALLTSSTVPLVFAPRPIGDDVYVDGGVLQNIPVQAAVNLGADDIVAVVGVPLSMPYDERDFTSVNFLGVYLRAVGAISFADRQRANLDVRRPDDSTLTVVAPTLDVVGPFEVEHGLMLLDMDYGWLRAAETFADLSAADRAVAQQASDRVTAARELAWYLEEDLWAAGGATDEELRRLRDLKVRVRAAMQRRTALGLAAPDGAERWHVGYEAHTGERPAGLPDRLDGA
jgi:hypothetical protein